MEYVFAVVGFVGFAATTVEIIKNNSHRAIALFVLTAASLTFAGVLWTRDQELRDGKRTAAEVLERLPSPNNFEFASNGEMQAAVLATIAFLESRKNQFPDTLAAAKDTYGDLRRSQAEDDPRKCPVSEPVSCPSDVQQRNRDRIELAAGTMYGLLLSIAGDYAD